MTKRKLTRRQNWRIEKIQSERIARAHRREARAQEAQSQGELGVEQSGLVVAHFGSQVAVEATTGEQYRCYLRANVDDLVAGDRVIWREGGSEGVVEAREPRRTELLRPDPHGDMKAVAANVDQVFVVTAAVPAPVPERIDRYLVAARAVGMEAVIVLNKADLLGADNRAMIAGLLKEYADLGYTVLQLSAFDESSLIPLYEALESKSSIFSGTSGVGKSSLVNALLPAAEQRVGDVSIANNSAGRHTTTTAQLFHLPCGGALLDSPGIREFGLWHMPRETIESGFVEFLPLLGYCRFRDCQHEHEPGCALLEAVAQGDVSPRRFASFQRLVSAVQP